MCWWGSADESRAGCGLDLPAHPFTRPPPPPQTDVPLPYSAALEKLCLPSVADVVFAAKKACFRGSRKQL